MRLPARLKILGLTLFTLLAVSYAGIAPAEGADGDMPAYEMPKVTPFDFRGDVRDLPLVYRPAIAGPTPPSVRPLRTPPPGAKPTAPAAETSLAGPAAISAPLAPMPSPAQNFAGLSFLDSCGGVRCGAGYPPDTNGDVGLNHYIQAVNDAYAIYSKTGTLLASFTENQLWGAAGATVVGGAGLCGTNSFGDPVVLYDRLADRFILTHFAFAESGGNPVSPFYQCIAASKSGNPVSGGWWLYAVRMDPGSPGPPIGALNDYSKFGLWTDCLYMAANEFAPNFIGTAFASFSRSDLFSGAPLTWSLGFINTNDPFTMIPSNLLGKSAGSLPPPGTPNYFVSESQTAFAFEVRKFTAGPNCGAGGSLSGPTNVGQVSYPFPLSNVPQPGTSIQLDSIDDRLMQKVQYRKVGNTESLWVVHNVQTSSSTVALQWAQFNVTDGVISAAPVQQQIYAPDTTLHRWMGSLAVDSQGNMALGYSTSSSSAFPSIAYSGRLATDPLNTLPQSEVQLVAGGGSQTNIGRWGDYSAMSIDPADDCTFWYTNEYYATSGSTWSTRIGSFKFPSCTSGPSVTVAKAGTGSGTVTGSDGVINCGPVCVETVPSGTSITLTATAASNSNFTGWSGGACSGTGTCTVTVTSAITVTATFTLKTFSLAVVRAGTGAGTVTSSDGAINCGSVCSETVASGTGVTLTATPGANSTFAGWSGGGCSGTGTCKVTVTSATTVSATFTLAGGGVTLTVTKLGSGLGTVTSTDDKINCGATCSVVYGAATSVTLSATGSGATFKQWGGACSGTVVTCTITLNTTQSVTATFSETFTDGSGSTSQISPATTVIKAVHVLELRTAVNTLRAVNGLTAFSWTDATLTAQSTTVGRLHFLDLRTALSAVCALFPGRCTAYTDPTITAGQTVIKAAHLNELRANVRALE